MTSLSEFLHRWHIKPQDIAAQDVDHLLTFDPAAWTPEAIRSRHPELALPTGPFVHKGKNILDRRYKAWANCYLYALGDCDLFLARLCQENDLGILAGAQKRLLPNLFTQQDVIELAREDGLVLTGSRIDWDPQARPVALFVSEDHDFHWARLDRIAISGTWHPGWSHKFAHRPPCLLTTAEGALILDPRRLRFNAGHDEGSLKEPSPYVFAAFFNVPRDLSIRPDVIAAYQAKGENLLTTPERAWMQSKGAHGVAVPQLG